ncbi:MAG: hypothetical protein FRX49_06442 [Trebouxia sp. A1-2]|nr:MAG: hypothetical protein FRX49_06442 [Trebouxia sp. A1-2]
MPQHSVSHVSDISKHIADFGQGLQTFSQRLEQDVDELKRAVACKPRAGRAQVQHCLQDMVHRAAATGQEISALEAVTVDAVSLEELVGHCLQLLQENHTRISTLEAYLQQYGYKPSDNLSVPVNLLELAMSSGKITTFLLHALRVHQASQRQPFRQMTNHIAGASPPIKQQPTVEVSEALQTRYKSQTLSMDRITPTPSPVLSSSTDMPYSPSMRALLDKYGSASFDSHSGSHRDSIESVSMPDVQQASLKLKSIGTPEPCVVTSPVQPMPFIRAAHSGSSCLSTPDHHQALAGHKPSTPDTANLLQRALASSGSAVLNRLTASNSLQPLRGASGLAEAQGTGGSGNTHSLPRLDPDQQQQQQCGAVQSAVGAGQQAQAGHRRIIKPLYTDLGPQQGLPQPLEKADQQVGQTQQEDHGHISKGERQARKAEQEASKAAERPQRPDQQADRAEQIVKGQHQAAVPTPKLPPIPAAEPMHSAAAVQDVVGTLSAAVDSSLTEGEDWNGTRHIAAHVTQNEYMDLGIMQRKHFALDQINHAVDLMHSLSHAGFVFKTEDLSSLQIGDMKTKMLLGALTKLGKLRVQVDNGQIIGYRMTL